MERKNTCRRGHVDPERYRNRVCKQCQYENNRARRPEAGKRQRAARRARVLQHYGGQCACCGETWSAFLQLDHIDGDGAAHRAEIRSGKQRNGAGDTTYRWIEANGYPAGFQVLCANCNSAKERPEGCPPGHRLHVRTAG